MPDYTKINFADVEDSAGGRGYDLQGRFARKHIESEHLGVSQFSYGPGVRAPYGHRHQEQEEVYVVTGGSGRMKLDDEIIDLRRGIWFGSPPGWSGASSAGPEGLELIAVGSDRPEAGDGELIEDFWTD